MFECVYVYVSYFKASIAIVHVLSPILNMLTFDHFKSLDTAVAQDSVVGQADDEALCREDATALDVHLVAGGPGGVVRTQLQVG